MQTVSSSSLPDDSSLPPPPSYASLSSPLIPSHEPVASTSSTLAEAVHPAFQHGHSHLNLPSGLFLLRNRAQGKALDLLGHRTHEGAEFGVHPVKQPELKGLSLVNNRNNQLFFLDWDGQLTAAAASRAVEVVGTHSCSLDNGLILSLTLFAPTDGELALAFPHPIMNIPSSLSHPLPRFRLDPQTSTLHVLFSSDPLYRGPGAPEDWKDDDYIVEVVPRRRKPSEPPLWGNKDPKQVLSDFGQKAGGVLGGFGERVGGIFGRKSTPSSPALGYTPDHELPLPPPPVPEKPPSLPSSPQPNTSALPPTSTDPLPSVEETSSSRSAEPVNGAEESDADDDSDSEPSAFRPVRVVRLPPHWRDKFPSDALRTSPSTSFGVTSWPASAKELRLWRRRQWEVVPVTVQPVPLQKGSFPIPSPVGSPNDSEEDYSVGSDGSGDEREEGEEEQGYVSSAANRLASINPFSSASPASSPSLAASAAQTGFSSLTSAASTAQSHATSAATALGGLFGGAFSRREAEEEDEDVEAPLPALPEKDGAESGGGAGGEWDDAPVVQNDEIEGLTAGPADREVKWGEAAPAVVEVRETELSPIVTATATEEGAAFEEKRETKKEEVEKVEEK
jgi:hypothetical protein